MPRPPLFVFFVLALSTLITAVGYAESDSRHAVVSAPSAGALSVEVAPRSPHPGRTG
ncbi:hypothetical protein [Sagittula sp. P11]|uniref:hypothetical protein n=1 Tax=Sagittula sp. P11 TaxID=2009329 RepID=UPI0012FD0F32|nr:hypothetical protein [Sagittula sp. P11]